MGVSYTAKVRYGILIDPEDSLPPGLEILAKLDDPDCDAEDSLFEFAARLGCEYTTAGSYYTGSVWWLIGPRVTWDNAAGTAVVDQVGLTKLRQYVSENCPSIELRWHFDTLVH
jgi:hypothetical protein